MRSLLLIYLAAAVSFPLAGVSTPQKLTVILAKLLPPE